MLINCCKAYTIYFLNSLVLELQTNRHKSNNCYQADQGFLNLAELSSVFLRRDKSINRPVSLPGAVQSTEKRHSNLSNFGFSP